MSLYLGDRTGYALIMDNGYGMSSKELQDFATHSLDHKARQARDSKKGLDVTASTSSIPSNTDQSFLSKFGVGAKQAGFYLGDRIRVITKQKESRVTEQQKGGKSQVVAGRQVKEFVIDEKELDERFRQAGTTEAAYQGSIEHRHIGEAGRLMNQEERDFPLHDGIEAEINAFELDHADHFTIIVLRLRPEIRAQLGMNTYLASQMAEIYYFHLHPEHTYDSLKNHSKFSHQSGGSTKRFVCLFSCLFINFKYDFVTFYIWEYIYSLIL